MILINYFVEEKNLILFIAIFCHFILLFSICYLLGNSLRYSIFFSETTEKYMSQIEIKRSESISFLQSLIAQHFILPSFNSSIEKEFCIGIVTIQRPQSHSYFEITLASLLQAMCIQDFNHAHLFILVGDKHPRSILDALNIPWSVSPYISHPSLSPCIRQAYDYAYLLSNLSTICPNVIMLEDDLIVAKNFISFLQKGCAFLLKQKLLDSFLLLYGKVLDIILELSKNYLLFSYLHS
jgi:hypothetical protein